MPRRARCAATSPQPSSDAVAFADHFVEADRHSVIIGADLPAGRTRRATASPADADQPDFARRFPGDAAEFPDRLNLRADTDPERRRASYPPTPSPSLNSPIALFVVRRRAFELLAASRRTYRSRT